MKLTWIVFLIQALFSKIFLTNIQSDILSVIVVIVTTLFFIVDLSKQEYSKKVFFILFLSYFLRIFLLFFDIYGSNIYSLPNSGADSEMYNRFALEGLITGDFGRGEFYSRVIGIIYTLFGYQRILAQYLNVLLSMNTILITNKLMRNFNIQAKYRNLALFLMAVLPNFAILSSILLRETIITFLITVSFYNFSKWLIDGNYCYLGISYILSLIASLFHSGSLFLFLGYTIVIILYKKNLNKFQFNSKSIFITILFFLIFIFLYVNYSEVLFSKFRDVEDLSDITDVTVLGGSGYSVGIPINNPLIDFIINTPVRMFYFVLAPLPWDWRGIVDITSFLFSSLFYGYTLYIALQSLRRNLIEKNSEIIVLIIIIVVGLIFFGWGVSNAGTALRHRYKFISLFIVLFSLVKSKSKPK